MPIQSKKRNVILFTKCTGLNDSSQTSDSLYLEDGTTDVIGCLNVTTTKEGKLVKVPSLTTVVTHSTVIDELTADLRMLVQNGTTLSEFNGTTITQLTSAPVFTAGVKAAYIHTPIDIRIRTSSTIRHKLVNGTTSTVALSKGTYVGPEISRASVFDKMPDFTGGFVLGAKLYAMSGKYLLSSEPYCYDLWHPADTFIPHTTDVLQTGQIPGCFVALHSNGITGYFAVGGSFRKEFFPCAVIPGTLYSGYVSKVITKAHVFMCTDGVYALTSDGKLTNLTVLNTHSLNTLNTSYKTVSVFNGKYLAFGNSVCVEYDFQTKALLLRSLKGITSSCVFGGKLYFSSSNLLLTSVSDDNAETIACSVKLPYNNFGISNIKQIRFLYFTGKATGDLTVTVRNQLGGSVTKTYTAPGYVQKYKLDGLRLCNGEKLSVELSCTTGEFKLEELSASCYICSSRS